MKTNNIVRTIKDAEHLFCHEVITHNSVISLKTGADYYETTYGRMKICALFGLDLNEANLEQMVGLDKNKISECIENMIRHSDFTEDELLRRIDELSTLGFEISTHYAISMGMDDLKCPQEYLKIKEDTINEWKEDFKDDYNSEEAKRSFGTLTKFLDKEFLDKLDDKSIIRVMYNTKARVSDAQLRQLVNFRGQLITPSGLSTPIFNSMADGLDPFDYITTARAGRMALLSNSTAVPKAGYLTRQLEAAGRDILVCSKEEDSKVKIPLPLEVSGEYLKKCGGVRFDIDGEIIDCSTVDVDKIYHIQSPVTCYGPISREQLGTDPANINGDLFPYNTHIGVISALTLSEGLLQAGLSQKHSSGAINLEENLDNASLVPDGLDLKVVDTKVTSIESTVSREKLKLSEVTVEDLNKNKYVYKFIGDNVVLNKSLKNDVVGFVPSDINGSDIMGTIDSVINFLGGSNPGYKNTEIDSLVTPISGRLRYEVQYKQDSKRGLGGKIDVYVDDLLLGEVLADQCLVYPEGYVVEPLTYITTGTPNLSKFYDLSDQDLSLTYRLLYEFMSPIDSSIHPIHYEVLFRILTEYLTEDPELDLYYCSKLRSAVFNYGTPPEITKLYSIPSKAESWMKRISFNNIKRTFVDALITANPSSSSQSQSIMSGSLIKQTEYTPNK